MLHEALDALLLDELEELVLLDASFLLRQFASQLLELYGTGVALGIDGMSDAVDESRLVVCLLVEHAVQVGINLVDVGPVLDLVFQVVEHIDDLDVGTSVKWTFQRPDTCSYGGIGVCTCRRGDAHGERRVVTTSVLSLRDEQQVERPRIQFGIVVVLQHEEEVLSYGQVLLGIAYVQGASVLGVPVDVVCVSDDGGELGNQLYRLSHEVVARYVVGVAVEGIHLQYATCQDVHDVGTFEVYQVYDCTVVERHVVVQQFAESRQLLLVRQLSGEQQECHLLESEALLLQERSHQLVEFVSAIEQLAFAWLGLAVFADFISDDVSDVGQSDEHTRSVFVSQSSLHAELRKQFVVYLARVLYLVAELIN